MTAITGTDVALSVKLLNDLATPPSAQSDLAAGLDVHAALEEAVWLAPGRIRLIPTGFAIAIPPGFEAQIRPRSGLALRHGITLVNSPGTIDADYRGEVQVPLINLGRHPFAIMPRMRIAQMVVAPIARCAVNVVAHLDETERGAGGFGSTGV